MKKIEKEYNKRFSNQQLSTGDFDADGLWDAISDNLDVAPPASPSNWWSTNWVLGLTLIFVVGAIFKCYQIGTKNLISSSSTNKIEEILENEIIIVENIKNTNKSAENTNSAEEIYNPTPSQSESFKSNQSPSTRKSNIKKNVKYEVSVEKIRENASGINRLEYNRSGSLEYLKNNIDPSYPASERFKTLNIESSANKSLEKEDRFEFENSSTRKKENYLEAKKEVTIGLTLMSLPALSTLLVSNEEEQDLPRLPVSDNEIDTKIPKTIALQFSLLGGVNNLNFQYASKEPASLAELRDQTDTGQWGNNFGFKTSLVFKDTWVLSSGLEYQNIYSRFDLINITNTQILRENQILKIWIDATTRDTLNSVVGDTLVDVITTRTIIHHNRYQQFTLPLDFGFRKIRRGFIYGVQAGASFNFVHAQSGKTINLDGEIVSFDSDSAYTPFRSFHIGLRLSPLVGYQISNNWAMTIQPQWAWNPQAGFDDPDLKLSTQQFNLVLGVRYSL